MYVRRSRSRAAARQRFHRAAKPVSASAQSSRRNCSAAAARPVLEERLQPGAIERHRLAGRGAAPRPASRPAAPCRDRRSPELADAGRRGEQQRRRHRREAGRSDIEHPRDYEPFAPVAKNSARRTRPSSELRRPRPSRRGLTVGLIQRDAVAAARLRLVERLVGEADDVGGVLDGRVGQRRDADADGHRDVRALVDERWPSTASRMRSPTTCAWLGSEPRQMTANSSPP